jgi:hypothetical protein
MMDPIWLVLLALVTVVPTWRIFVRCGLAPGLALIALIPGIGVIICGAILAFVDWPAQTASSDDDGWGTR